MNEKEIAAQLKIIFDENRDNPNFWNRNPVGKTIKKHVELIGNWKKRGNGRKNASLGHQIQALKVALRNNPDIRIPSHLAKYVS